MANKVTGVFRSHEVRQGAYTLYVILLSLLTLSFSPPYAEGYEIEHDGLCTTVRMAHPYLLCSVIADNTCYFTRSSPHQITSTCQGTKAHL